MATQEQSYSTLAGLVRRYQVCWEVWPEDMIAEGKARQVGFELELSGTPEGGTDQFAPGSQACRQVYSALQDVADWILPKEQRPSMYEIGPYAQALRYSAVRNNRPDVTLSVKILHRRGFDQPVDACEVRCLEDMKQRLTQLGACERRWSSREAS